MKIAVPAERDPGEGRVAATPDTVKKFKALGFDVTVESGAGTASRIPDAEFEAAGATIAADAAGTWADADVVLKVRRPGPEEIKLAKAGALVVGTMDPYGNTEAVQTLASAGVSAFAMEFMPRITRAQVMDILSSAGQSRRLPGRHRCGCDL